MGMFSKKTPEERRAAESKKIRKVRVPEEDRFGLKALRRNEERAKIWRSR